LLSRLLWTCRRRFAGEYGCCKIGWSSAALYPISIFFSNFMCNSAQSYMLVVYPICLRLRSCRNISMDHWLFHKARSWQYQFGSWDWVRWLIGSLGCGNGIQVRSGFCWGRRIILAIRRLLIWFGRIQRGARGGRGRLGPR